MRGFHKVLQRLSSLNGTDYSRFPSSICTKLTKMFQIYETKFGGVCLNTQPMLGAGSGKATKAWDDIYGDDETYNTSFGTCTGNIHGVATPGSSSSLSELTSYLDSDNETKFGPYFNIIS
jgi:hypothetical protein